jgi:hypothetical protein
MQRIEVARRLFGKIWFDEEGMRGGIDALLSKPQLAGEFQQAD